MPIDLSRISYARRVYDIDDLWSGRLCSARFARSTCFVVGLDRSGVFFTGPFPVVGVPGMGDCDGRCNFVGLFCAGMGYEAFWWNGKRHEG